MPGPAGSINSSVADMSKWVLLQLNHGTIPATETRIFSERVSQEMWAQQMIVPVRPAPAEIEEFYSRIRRLRHGVDHSRLQRKETREPLREAWPGMLRG